MQMMTRYGKDGYCTLPDHVERELTRKCFKEVKQCLVAGGSILSCSIEHGAQPLQVGYAHRTKSYSEYLLCKKEMGEPKKVRALTVVHR